VNRNDQLERTIQQIKYHQSAEKKGGNSNLRHSVSGKKPQAALADLLYGGCSSVDRASAVFNTALHSNGFSGDTAKVFRNGDEDMTHFENRRESPKKEVALQATVLLEWG
jgi:hypothetical protein